MYIYIYACKTKLRVLGGQLLDDGLSSPNTLWFWYGVVNPRKCNFMFVTNTGCMEWNVKVKQFCFSVIKTHLL